VDITWWRNPWHFIPVLWIVSGVIAAAVWAYQFLHPELDLALVFALPVAVFTASFSASMGMWLYSHITRESRDAQFRFERIYTPLYDDLQRVIQDLDRGFIGSLQKWQEINDTHLKVFVAQEVGHAVEDLVRELKTYHEVWNEAYSAAEKILIDATMHLTDRVGSRNPGPEIVTEVKSSGYQFLFDPNTTTLDPNRMTNIVNRIGQAGYQDARRLADEMVKKMKETLVLNGKVVARLREIEALMPKVEAVRELVHQRLIRPLS